MNKFIFIVMCLITIRYAAAMNNQNLNATAMNTPKLKIKFKKYTSQVTRNVEPKKIIRIKFNGSSHRHDVPIQEEQDAEIYGFEDDEYRASLAALAQFDAVYEDQWREQNDDDLYDSEDNEPETLITAPAQFDVAYEDQWREQNDDDLYDSEDNEPVVSRDHQPEGRGQKRTGGDLNSEVPAKRKKGSLNAESPILLRLQQLVWNEVSRQDILVDLKIADLTLRNYLCTARKFGLLTTDDCLYLNEIRYLRTQIVKEIKAKKPRADILHEYDINEQQLKTICAKSYQLGELTTKDTLYLKNRRSAIERPDIMKQKIVTFVTRQAARNNVTETKLELFHRFIASADYRCGRGLTYHCFFTHMKKLIADGRLSNESINFYERCDKNANKF